MHSLDRTLATGCGHIKMLKRSRHKKKLMMGCHLQCRRLEATKCYTWNGSYLQDFDMPQTAAKFMWAWENKSKADHAGNKISRPNIHDSKRKIVPVSFIFFLQRSATSIKLQHKWCCRSEIIIFSFQERSNDVYFVSKASSHGEHTWAHLSTYPLYQSALETMTLFHKTK